MWLFGDALLNDINISDISVREKNTATDCGSSMIEGG